MCQRVHGNHARKLSCHLVSGIPFTNTEHVEFLLNGNEANYIHLDFIQLNFKKSYPIRKVRGIGGLVVEYSPATRVTRVRFPVVAQFLCQSFRQIMLELTQVVSLSVCVCVFLFVRDISTA